MLSRLKVMGFVMLAAGALLAAMVAAHPETLRAPAWVAYVGSIAFVLAGCSSLARACGRERLALGFVCLVLAALAAVQAWIGFWPGARQCSAYAGGLGLLTPEISCRTAFVTGALVIGTMLIAAVRSWLRGRRTERQSIPADNR